jgi:hypothetical protein
VPIQEGGIQKKWPGRVKHRRPKRRALSVLPSWRANQLPRPGRGNLTHGECLALQLRLFIEIDAACLPSSKADDLESTTRAVSKK